MTADGYASIHPQPAYATNSLGKAGLRAATALLHEELKSNGVHVAGVAIADAIEAGTTCEPDRIANTVSAVHSPVGCARITFQPTAHIRKRSGRNIR